MTLDGFLQNFATALSQPSVLSFAIALVAGIVASAVCPCTLPMGIGVASATGATESRSRSKGLLIAVIFFSGIVVNLVLLGAVAGRLGAILTEGFGLYWALTMSIVSFAAAIAAFWGPQVRVSKLSGLRRAGFSGAFIYGFIFSLGTSAAPLLLLLTVAAAQARPLYGAILALAFGLGRGLPFLLVGLFAGALARFTRLGNWQRAMQIVSGAALILVSFYYARVFTAFL